MPLTYGALIKRALLAGLAAGLLLALYTLVVVEPSIDRAIALEEEMAEAHASTDDGHSHADDDEAMFSRGTQVGGGMAATIIYAAIAAAVFGTVLASIRHRLPHLSELTRVVWLAAVAFGTVALMPALKYPANPPAVGDPDTVNERTVQYLVLVGLSVALAVGLVRLSGWLRPRLDPATRLVAVAAATVVAYGLLLVLMPPSPDTIDAAVPAQLVWDFRIRSLGGLALLWTAIGLGLGWALDRLTADQAATAEPSAARGMTAAIEVLDRVTGTVDYLRVTVGDVVADAGAPPVDWLPCDRLSSDPEALGALARSTAAGRGTDRDDVAVSLLVQGYAFRIASLAIGAWFLDDAVLDVAPARTSIAIGRSRPNAVRFDDVRLVPADDPLAGLHAQLIDGHLGPLVDTAHRACRVGEALLWSNVAASCASAFGAFMGPLPDRHGEIRDRATAFFESARPELGGSGQLVPVGTQWAWERRACCLWYKASGGSRCADCSLWTDAERQERYAAAIAAQAEPTVEVEGST